MTIRPLSGTALNRAVAYGDACDGRSAVVDLSSIRPVPKKKKKKWGRKRSRPPLYKPMMPEMC